MQSTGKFHLFLFRKFLFAFRWQIVLVLRDPFGKWEISVLKLVIEEQDTGLNKTYTFSTPFVHSVNPLIHSAASHLRVEITSLDRTRISHLWYHQPIAIACSISSSCLHRTIEEFYDDGFIRFPIFWLHRNFHYRDRRVGGACGGWFCLQTLLAVYSKRTWNYSRAFCLISLCSSQFRKVLRNPGESRKILVLQK